MYINLLLLFAHCNTKTLVKSFSFIFQKSFFSSIIHPPLPPCLSCHSNDPVTSACTSLSVHQSDVTTVNQSRWLTSPLLPEQVCPVCHPAELARVFSLSLSLCVSLSPSLTHTRKHTDTICCCPHLSGCAGPVVCACSPSH